MSGLCLSGPGCPEAELLGPSSASCSQEERTEQRIPEPWPSFYFPQLIPGSTCGRPKLSAAQPAVPPPTFLLSLSLLRSLPRIPLLNLVPQNPQHSRAPGEFLSSLPLKQRQDSVCQLKKELISTASAAAVCWGPQASAL